MFENGRIIKVSKFLESSITEPQNFKKPFLQIYCEAYIALKNFESYFYIRDKGGVTGGWVTDRFPKIKSGSLIEVT